MTDLAGRNGVIRLHLLGGFRLESASGAPIHLAGRKAPALLAYLALCPGMTASRERLASLLWEEMDNDHARNNLRQILSLLRRAFSTLGQDPFFATNEAISLRDSVWIDAQQFREMAAAASAPAWQQASDLYAGALLDGVQSGSDAWDEWVRTERDKLAAEAIDVLEKLMQSSPAQSALVHCRKLLAIDPAREASHLTKMRLHLMLGQADMALRQYDTCKDFLWRDLAVTPSADMETLRQQILDSIAAGSAPPAAPVAGTRKGWVDTSRKSILILPFLNLSGDAEQDYFTDGITEDILTELARCSTLFVLSRNISLHYKGHTGLVQQIGGETGADYVVEGSVRRTGHKLRITCQLVEAASGHAIWAERFDSNPDDVFALEDTVVGAIASAIPGAVNRQIIDGSRRKPPQNLTAYECELRGRWAFHHWSEGVAEAITWFERAIAADPDYAAALAWLARCLKYSTLVGGAGTDDKTRRARELIDRAVTLENHNASIHANAASIYLGTGNARRARMHAERACALNPNDPATLNVMAFVLTYTGSPEEALQWHARSERIEPYAADDQRLDIVCDTHYVLGQYEKVIEIHERYLNAPGGVKDILAAALAQAGHIGRAREVIAAMEKSGFSREESARSIAIQMLHCLRPEDREHWLAGYRKAGLDV